jgi:hypothetical protein
VQQQHFVREEVVVTSADQHEACRVGADVKRYGRGTARSESGDSQCGGAVVDLCQQHAQSVVVRWQTDHHPHAARPEQDTDFSIERLHCSLDSCS